MTGPAEKCGEREGKQERREKRDRVLEEAATDFPGALEFRGRSLEGALHTVRRLQQTPTALSDPRARKYNSGFLHNFLFKVANAFFISIINAESNLYCFAEGVALKLAAIWIS